MTWEIDCNVQDGSLTLLALDSFVAGVTRFQTGRKRKTEVYVYFERRRDILDLFKYACSKINVKTSERKQSAEDLYFFRDSIYVSSLLSLSTTRPNNRRHYSLIEARKI